MSHISNLAQLRPNFSLGDTVTRQGPSTHVF